MTRAGRDDMHRHAALEQQGDVGVPQETAEQMVEAVLNLPFSARAPDGVTLGQRLRLTNAERERLRLWTIAPCDMSAEDMAEQRKAKARERMRRYRAKRGAKTRAEYRGNSIAKTSPGKRKA